MSGARDYVRLQRHQRKALLSLLESFCHPSKDNGQATSWGFSVNSSANPTMGRAGGIKKCLQSGNKGVHYRQTKEWQGGQQRDNYNFRQHDSVAEQHQIP